MKRLAILALASCGHLDGLGGDVPPLATIQLEVTGQFADVAVPGSTDPALSVALVWGAQWLPEALCFVPPGSADVAAVVAAGCRDPFGFVPDRAAQTVAVEPNVPAELALDQLPSADVLIGDVTGRIAYASLVAFDDRDADGQLDLTRARRVPDAGDEPPELPDPLMTDVVYGASFVSMTAPDVRIALREGTYDELAAFYPRRGCGAPPPGFSVVAAGGFSPADAIAAVLANQLPSQDPARCSETTLDQTTVEVPLRDPAELRELRCTGRRADSSVRYRDPPAISPDFTNRVTACASVPDFGTGTAAGIVQLVVSSRSDEPCRQLTHYVLKGCESDAACALPEWDLTATPPAWWPCPIGGGP